jgi:hypothetical protein
MRIVLFLYEGEDFSLPRSYKHHAHLPLWSTYKKIDLFENFPFLKGATVRFFTLRGYDSITEEPKTTMQLHFVSKQSQFINSRRKSKAKKI